MHMQMNFNNQHPLKSVSIWFSSCQNGCNLHAKGVTWVECQNIWLCEWWPGMIIAFNGLNISVEVYTIRLMTEKVASIAEYLNELQWKQSFNHAWMYLHTNKAEMVYFLCQFFLYFVWCYFNGPLECIWLLAAETQSPLEQVFCLVFRTSSRYNCSWLSPLNFQLGEWSLNGSFFLSKGSGWKR